MTLATIYRYTDPIENKVFFVGATDSLFSPSLGNDALDWGAKIWALTPRSFAVFAGAVAEAEAALALAKKRIALKPPHGPDVVRDELEASLRHFARAGRDVWVLAAAIGSSGDGHLWKACSPKYEMLPATSPAIIGHPAVTSVLDTKVGEARMSASGAAWMNAPMWMQLGVPVIVGMDQVILEGHPSIGGKVQTVVLTSGGLKSIRAKRNTKGAADWEQIDALPGEVKSLRRQAERRGPTMKAIGLREG